MAACAGKAVGTTTGAVFSRLVSWAGSVGSGADFFKVAHLVDRGSTNSIFRCKLARVSATGRVARIADRSLAELASFSVSYLLTSSLTRCVTTRRSAVESGIALFIPFDNAI